MTTMVTFEGQASDGAQDRGPTQFQSVGNAPATYNGYTLMVTAYALIWVILMVWLLMVWQKSRTIAARVADLDLAIDRAAAKSAQKDDKKGAGADGTADS
jgi:hypothetical protein